MQDASSYRCQIHISLKAPPLVALLGGKTVADQPEAYIRNSVAFSGVRPRCLTSPWSLVLSVQA